MKVDAETGTEGASKFGQKLNKHRVAHSRGGPWTAGRNQGEETPHQEVRW